MNPERSVLVVEDDPTQAELACENLRRAGYSPTLAGSLTEATLLESIPFSAVFLDLLLPETRDRDFTRAVSCIRFHFPKSALIVLSAFLPETNVMSLLKHGADMCLHKPLNSANIPAILNRATALHQGKLDGIWERLESIPLV